MCKLWHCLAAHQALLCLQVATNSPQELPLVLQRGEGSSSSPAVQGSPLSQAVSWRGSGLQDSEAARSGLQAWPQGAHVQPVTCWGGGADVMPTSAGMLARALMKSRGLSCARASRTARRGFVGDLSSWAELINVASHQHISGDMSCTSAYTAALSGP